MATSLDFCLTLIDQGKFSEAYERLLQVFNDDNSCHEAMLLLGCLYLPVMPIEAAKCFSMASSLAPDNSAYRFFKELAVMKSSPGSIETPQGSESDLLALNLDDQLGALPIIILCREACGQKYAEAAKSLYGKSLALRGRRAEAEIIANLSGADWQWFEAKTAAVEAMEIGQFNDDDLIAWLCLLENTATQKSISLAKVLTSEYLGRQRNGATSEKSGENTDPLHVTSLQKRNLVAFSPAGAEARIFVYGR